ncbi:glycosyltransferase [Derxia gummosa]|uniref:Glycosyltransferase n=1 Tax=Derxia gummosa DSM 723 TaxID=1121388 RepID=A0A8B6XA31_9BURK|nr:glycosyltransferase [Derxia gummosa]
MVHLLHVAETLKGGIASYLEETIPAQVREHGQFSVTLLVPDSQLSYLHLEEQVRIISFRDDCSRPRRILRIQSVLNRLLANSRVDLIHAHSSYAGAAVRLLLRGKGPKVVYCPHGWAFDRFRASMASRALGTAERILSRWSDQIICISEHEARLARRHRIPARRLKVVRSGIAPIPHTALRYRPEVDTSYPWPEGSLRLLFVGRMDRQKGIDLLLLAMRRMGPSVHLCIVGDVVLGGTELPPVSTNVTLVGWKPRVEVAAYMEAADALVMPSRWEGFGLTAVEAMRVGLPVLAASVGGLREIVTDGESGLLFAPDSVDDIVRALDALSPDIVERMGRAARLRFVEHFSSERMNRQLSAVYRGLLGEAEATSDEEYLRLEASGD